MALSVQRDGRASVVALDRSDKRLDRLRAGALQLTPALSTLLLQCNDQIRFLIHLAQSGGAASADCRPSISSSHR